MPKKGVSKYDGKFEIGQVIGKWEVIDSVPIIGKFAKIKCRCKCGDIRLIDAYSLLSGHSKSCLGCSGRRGSDNPSWTGFGMIPGSYFKRVQRSARQRGISFGLTIQDLDARWRIQNGRCAFTDLPLTFGTPSLGEFKASLDREYSQLGYTRDNIVWVTAEVNIMKNRWGQDYFRFICQRVADTQYKGIRPAIWVNSND